MTIPLPPPVPGDPFDIETAAGRVSGYRLGEGRTVLLSPQLQRGWGRRGAGPPRVATRGASPRGAGGLARLRYLGSAGCYLRLGALRRAAGARPPGRAGSGRDLGRCRRALAAGAVRRGRGSRSSGAVRSNRAHQPHGLRSLQGQRRSDVPDPLPVPAPDRDRPAAVRGPRPTPGDPLVPPPDVRGSGGRPAGIRAVLLADLPAAGRLPRSAGVRLGRAERSRGRGRIRAPREPHAPRVRGPSALHRPGRGSRPRAGERAPRGGHGRAGRRSPPDGAPGRDGRDHRGLPGDEPPAEQPAQVYSGGSRIPITRSGSAG